MDNGQLYFYERKLRRVSAWWFLLGAVVFAALGVYFMRQNNLKMIELREAVAVADKTDGDVETALRALREHVYGHMNTNLSSGANAIKPPIQLRYRYERLVQAEADRVSRELAQIYTDAQTECERRFPGSFSGGPRVPCIEEYVASHQVSPRPIPDSLYKFDFVSPAWSPDLAGFSLLIATGLFVTFLTKYSIERWLRARLSD